MDQLFYSLVYNLEKAFHKGLWSSVFTSGLEKCKLKNIVCIHQESMLGKMWEIQKVGVKEMICFHNCVSY